MKVLINQFLSQNHSWSICGQNIARVLIKLGHNVDLFSTNGITYFPEDLKNNLIGYIDGGNIYGKLPTSYDMQFSYTSMKNFKQYLSYGNKNKFGMWSYEFQKYFPEGFTKCHNFVDFVMVPSTNTYNIFKEAGIPEQKIKIIPHGVDNSFFDDTSVFTLPLKFKDKVKIYVNIAQPHLRKGIEQLLEAFGKAFSKKDDVVLIFKVVMKKPSHSFEINVKDVLNRFYKKYPNHAEIFIIDKFVDNISSIYRACDIYFFPSLAEAFSLTVAEAMASGLITITSNYGGQLDFCNDDNCLLINGKMVKADPNMLYWTNHKIYNAEIFMPNIDECVDMLKFAVNNVSSLKEKYISNINYIKNNFNWDVGVKKILESCY